jgi:hypothetical protein
MFEKASSTKINLGEKISALISDSFCCSPPERANA